MSALNKRQIDIIKFLKGIEEWITIKTIAKKFDVSERTIRNDLYIIDDIFNKNNSIIIEKKPKIGIKMIIKNNQNLDEIINSYDNKIYSCGQRAIIIAMILLIKEDSTIEEISKEMNVSKNTVVRDLKLNKKKLIVYYINIVIQIIKR